MTFYRRYLPHIQRDGKPHFVTFATKDRVHLPDWARDIVMSRCKFGDGSQHFLRVAVVMPDHAHLVVEPLIDHERKEVFSLSRILRGIKRVYQEERLIGDWVEQALCGKTKVSITWSAIRKTWMRRLSTYFRIRFERDW